MFDGLGLYLSRGKHWQIFLEKQTQHVHRLTRGIVVYLGGVSTLHVGTVIMLLYVHKLTRGIMVYLGGVSTLHVGTVIILLYVAKSTSNVHVNNNPDRLNKIGMVAYLGFVHYQQKHPLVGENKMSSGWICWFYENVGEFVPFVLKVGETCLLDPLPFSNLSFAPTSFFRFIHLKTSPTCDFSFHPLVFSVSPTCTFHLLADCIYLHLFCVMISVVCDRLHDTTVFVY